MEIIAILVIGYAIVEWLKDKFTPAPPAVPLEPEEIQEITRLMCQGKTPKECDRIRKNYFKNRK